MGKRELEVGIVGYGVVGKATGLLFPPDWIYDPFQGKSKYDLLVVKNSVVFICVSTPFFGQGRFDLGPIEDSIIRFGDCKFMVMRSSVPPGTAAGLMKEYNVNIVSNPEFLRESSAEYDTLHPSRVVLGTEKFGTYAKDIRETLKTMYLESAADWSNCYGFVETDNTTAEMIKFVCNLFGACKVSLANEMYDVCQKVGANFEDIRRAVVTDPRLGAGFFAVTKRRGWGGRCFPKDMEIFLQWMKDNGMESKVLEAARDANLKYRKPGDES